MVPDRFTIMKELFQAALERDPGERKVYLAKACGSDIALRQDVEGLLRRHVEEFPLLDHPTGTTWTSLMVEATDEIDAEAIESGLPFQELGDFRLIRKIGEGGMGMVFLAIQEPFGRRVALKLLRSDLTGSIALRARFWREIKAVSELRHPNIATVFGSGEVEGVLYYAMDLIPGRGLDEMLGAADHEGKKIGTARVLLWVRDVARALQCAHEAGILHRDVKPSNIRITPANQAVLLDFGIARHIKLATLTLTGEFHGTPHYASPEQVRSAPGGIDQRTDVYSLGVTLYEAITGTVPFEGDTTEQLFLKILEKEPPAPRQFNPAISRDLETVILTTLEKDPAKRYPTMEELADDLERLLAGEMIRARPTGWVTKVWRRAKRHPIASSAITVALLSVVILCVSLSWYAIKIKKAQRELQAVNNLFERVIFSPGPSYNSVDVKFIDVLRVIEKELPVHLADFPALQADIGSQIATTYWMLGLLEDCRKLYQEVHTIQAKTLGERAPATLETQHNLAFMMGLMGELDDAEELLEEVVEQRSRLLGAEDKITLLSKCNLAEIIGKQGRLAEAEELMNAVLLAQNRNPACLIDRRRLQIKLAEIIKEKENRLPEADQILEDVIDEVRGFLSELCPNEDLPRAHDTDWLLRARAERADILRLQGRLDDAEDDLAQLIKDCRQYYREIHPKISKVVSYQARVWKEQGRLEDAAKALATIIELAKEIGFGDRLNEAGYRVELGACLLELERYQEAEAPLRQGYDELSAMLGDSHQQTKNAAALLTRLYTTTGQRDEADHFTSSSAHK